MPAKFFNPILALVVAAGAVGAGSFSASAIAYVNHSRWHQAILEPGARAPRDGQDASITALACGSPGNCLAGGYFVDNHGFQQAFTVSERNGTWQSPAELRGIFAVAPHGDSAITAAACGAAGNCVVGGTYPSGHGDDLPFVAREVAGTWQPAIRVPGITPVFGSQIAAASCGAPGNCLVGGDYSDNAGTHAFVLAEIRGTWRSAMHIPGLDALSTADFSETTALTCLSVGTCITGGLYFTSPAPGAADDGQDFVATEIKGVWKPLVTLTDTAQTTVTSLSCSSIGNCGVALGQGSLVGFDALGPAVATERNGSWGPAINVPGTRPDSKFVTGATSISCPATGACAVGGGYWTGHSIQSFVANEVGGTWHAAHPFPRIASLNLGRMAQVTSIACASAGNCVAGGNYLDRSNEAHAFLVSQTRGRWGSPFLVPGLAVLSAPYLSFAQINAVVCPAIGKCVAAGAYAHRIQEGFVISQG